MDDVMLNQKIESDYSHITGLAVQKDCVTVYERYYRGTMPEKAAHVFSVTKSITSILIGMAMEQGAIRNVDQNVLDFFPEYRVKRGERTIENVTIKNLLTMTAPYKYRSEPYTKVYGSEDWTKAALDLLGGKGAIGEFRYSTVGAQILSGIIEHAVGTSVIDFANKNLFHPLGIHDAKPIFVADKEAHLGFIKEQNAEGWIVDPNGVAAAGWGLMLCPRDMLKIGQLYLNKGVWDGKQLLSESWIMESTRTQANWKEYAYGYLWWNLDQQKPGCFAAMGDSGNIIYCDPKEKIVIAITGSFKPRAKLSLDLISDQIYPMIFGE
ncbi:MAG: serine hydrolase [Lachnospiraceae bacterium]|nr:serine hydrolase [Lachnospiraceae bacterium]